MYGIPGSPVIRGYWAVAFIPMPMPKTVRITCLQQSSTAGSVYICSGIGEIKCYSDNSNHSIRKTVDDTVVIMVIIMIIIIMIIIIIIHSNNDNANSSNMFNNRNNDNNNNGNINSKHNHANDDNNNSNYYYNKTNNDDDNTDNNDNDNNHNNSRAARVSTEVTFGRGDLSVCPLGGFLGALE